MAQSFGASFPLSGEGIADAALSTLISIAIKYISLLSARIPNVILSHFVFTSPLDHLGSMMAEQFQILRYLTGLLVLGILKKSGNVVQVCLGTWQTWYFFRQILIKQNSVQDSRFSARGLSALQTSLSAMTIIGTPL